LKYRHLLINEFISFFLFLCVKDLANATGNILENKELLQSLNKTKEKSATITNSLEESVTLGEDLDKVLNKSFN
jgi:CRISPR/Cas system-associated endonuclease Cas3-HD